MIGARPLFAKPIPRRRIASARIMRVSLAALALAAALSGCHKPSDANAPEETASAESDRTAATAEAFAIVAEFSAKDTVAAEKDSRILRWAESGCGMSPVVKTSSMLLSDAVLQPDFIVEFAADGRVLRTWGKPYNAQIGVLRGERISFSQQESGQERMYWTDTTGGIAPGDAAASARPRIDESAPVDCPSLELFGDSEYLQCFETLDAASRKPHRLAFEAACT
jgi:hypothetical protein